MAGRRAFIRQPLYTVTPGPRTGPGITATGLRQPMLNITGNNYTDIARVGISLFLIMDPIGNIPTFNAVLKDYPPSRRTRIVARELLIALAVLLFFLLAGTAILNVLGLSQPALDIAGGILLFIIAFRMIFPSGHRYELPTEEPFIVPLAVPMIAGPSTIAVLLLLSNAAPERMGVWVASLALAWGTATAILLASTWFMRLLGERGLRATERLMGMLLVLLAVQMLLNGFGNYYSRCLQGVGCGPTATALSPAQSTLQQEGQ